MEAEIGGRRMQRAERAIAEQLLEARALENAVRAAEGQRGPGDPADRLADPIFRTIEGGGRFRGRALRIAEPSRAVHDEPRGFEIGAHLGDVAAHIGVIGERLRITLRLARMHNPA